MNFIGGDRFFIESSHPESPVFTQIQDCIHNLCWNKTGTVYKLNFFVRTNSGAGYLEIQEFIQTLDLSEPEKPVLLNVIAQAPFGKDVIIEVFTYNPDVWAIDSFTGEFSRAIRFSRDDTTFLFGISQANMNFTCMELSEVSFQAMDCILNHSGFPLSSVIRQWNYIENILKIEEGSQCYQIFNTVRSAFYTDAFSENGYPAATGIGMNHGGVIIEFLAMKSGTASTLPIDNPLQVAAHHYSGDVLSGSGLLKATPKFERARFLKTPDQQLIFISGTAAIRGENTVSENDTKDQTLLTISNIRRLYSPEVLAELKAENCNPIPDYFRVYIREPEDFGLVQSICRKEFPSVPMVFIQADICRDNLRIEIEGEIILNS